MNEAIVDSFFKQSMFIPLLKSLALVPVSLIPRLSPCANENGSYGKLGGAWERG